MSKIRGARASSGRRERRHRIRSACIAAMLVPLMLLTLWDVQALHVEAMRARSLDVLAIGQGCTADACVTSAHADENIPDRSDHDGVATNDRATWEDDGR